MATWTEFSTAASDLASRIEARFTATKHHVLATLRPDGSPRVSGTEVDIHDGEMFLGSMLGAVKARDLRRDGRFAIHSNPGEATMEGGDAKVSGVAVEVTDHDKASEFHLFRLDIHHAVLTSLHPDGDRLVIESWRPEQGVRRTERR